MQSAAAVAATAAILRRLIRNRHSFSPHSRSRRDCGNLEAAIPVSGCDCGKSAPAFPGYKSNIVICSSAVPGVAVWNGSAFIVMSQVYGA